MVWKLFLILILVWFFPPRVKAQGKFDPAYGTIEFNTYAHGIWEKGRITFLDGSPVGDGFTGQLLAGPEGTPVGSLLPLLPTGQFHSLPPQYAGYIRGLNPLFAPNVPAGATATVVMRAYDGISWETATYRGESNPFIVYTGGPASPPGNLEGLRGFAVLPVPEPSLLALVLLGLLVFGVPVRLRKSLIKFNGIKK